MVNNWVTLGMKNKSPGLEDLMKLFKVIGIILISLCFLLLVLLGGSTLNHKSQLRKEAKTYPAPGELVDVNGSKLHVYGEGSGDATLVFMSGAGTSNPTLDFKPLWQRLTDDYRIVVVEKSGYGWSETSSNPRDLETMLSETREALLLAGETGPYVLVPHSMSGLEAIYWAQVYPEEVEAIIGLDPTTPEIFDHETEAPSKGQLTLMYYVSRMGISRFMPDSDLEINFPVLATGDLSQQDRDQFVAMFYRSAYTKDMLREIEYLPANASTVASNEIPVNMPMYFFISDGEDVAYNNWQEVMINYVSQLAVGKHKILNTGHYVHHEQSEVIAEEIKAFLKDNTN